MFGPILNFNIYMMCTKLTYPIQKIGKKKKKAVELFLKKKREKEKRWSNYVSKPMVFIVNKIVQIYN